MMKRDVLLLVAGALWVAAGATVSVGLACAMAGAVLAALWYLLGDA